MTAVACKELKNRLGKYLRLGRNGQTVQITERGKPIACILPTQSSKDQERARTLASLIAKGNIRFPTGKFRIRGRPKPAVLGPGKSIAEMVSEDRR